MARARRHKHHSRRSRSNWAVIGAFVASAAFAPRFDAAADAAELARRLEPLRIPVPAETHFARALPVQAPSSNERQLRFDIPPATLRIVLAEIERLSGMSIAITDAAIADISSPGVSGLLTPLEAVTRALEGTAVTARPAGPNRVAVEIRLASEDVHVTGAIPQPRPSSPKYTQPLIDVPQTIEVIPREIMEAQGVTTLSEALRNVPGISLQAGEGGGASNTSGDMFNLRGFSANNSLVVDGVRDDGLMSRDVFNLEQVEVFMGPAGSDVGRGNAAGYVNMQTKAPAEESAYAATYAYGSGDLSRVTLDLNQDLNPGAPDSWLGGSAIRLNALWEDGGVAGREVVTRKNQSVAPSIAFGLNTSTRVTAAAQITRQDNVPDYGIPGAAWPRTQLAPTTVIAADPVDSRNFYGSVGYDFDRAEQESYTGRIEHDINSNLTLRHQARYNETHRTAVITAVQSPASFVPASQSVTLSRQGNERENTILSNQTSLVARFETGRIRHSAIAGIEMASEEQFAPALIGVGARNPVSVYSPNPFDPVIGYDPQRGLAYTRGRTNSVGVYAFDTVNFGNRWELSGGLRWEHYDAMFKAADLTGAVTSDLAVADELISGKAGVLYRLTDAANVYFSYGSAVTPPGTANFTLSAQPNNQNNPNVKPQESKNYELGGKLGLYGNRLSLSAALFRTVNKNVIFTVDATAIPPIFNQDDGQRVDGFTIGSLGKITQRWQLLASVGYLHTRQITQNSVNNGKRLTLTPKLSGSVWTAYDFPRGLTLGGGVRYMDELFVDAANTIRVPRYSLVDAMIEYDVNTHLTLRLNANNLTDKVYVKNVNNNGGRFNPGTPRSAIVTTSVRF
ncbi:MAG: TonB-dependent siderophore receptor [Vicinamibacterales bacterium]